MNLKSIILLLIVLLILLLDWAALHDIMKGEPDLLLEYFMVAISLLVVPVMLNYVLRQSTGTGS